MSMRWLSMICILAGRDRGDNFAGERFSHLSRKTMLVRHAAVRHVISFLVIALMLVSHSVVGNAAPHADGSVHSHAHEMADTDHGADRSVSEETDDSVTPDTPDEGLAHASGHTHLASAVLSDANALLASSALGAGPTFAPASPALSGRE